MNQDERQMLQGLFDRLRDSGNQPRDPEAERFIADQIRMQPGAPYYMAQAVLIQEQTMQEAGARIAELEERIRQLEQTGQRPAASGGFLAGRTGGMFSRGEPAKPAATASVPAAGPWGRTSSATPQQPQYQQPQSQPYQAMQSPMQAQSSGFGGGGFLKGALVTAAGVAGGALLFDQLKGAFGGGHGAAQASTPPQPDVQKQVDQALDEAVDDEIAENESESYDSGSDSGGDIET